MRYGVSEHAVERYIERFKEHLEPPQARRELIALTALAKPLDGRPEWLGDGREADAWLELCDDVVAAVRGETVVTVFSCHRLSKEARAKRNAHKRRRRAARKTRNASSLNRRSSRPEVREEPWPT